MPHYWLTPVLRLSPFTLGRDRFPVPDGQPFGAFRDKLRAVQPKLLPLFKAGLLPSDDEGDEAACGVEGSFFSLDEPRAICFDGSSGPLLSHCAQAFADRLPRAADALRMTEQAQQVRSWLPDEELWLSRTADWLREGCAAVVILLE